MPALPDAERVIRVNMPIQLTGNSHVLNRFFVRFANDTPTVAQLSTFCDAVTTSWGAHLKSLHNTAVVMGPVSAEDLTSTGGPVAAGTTSQTGTRSGAALPAGTCVNVQFLLTRRYRGGKPKIFLPAGVGPDMASAVAWGSGLVSAVGSGWAAFMTDVKAAVGSWAGTLEHVNVSYYSGFHNVTNSVTGRARAVPTLRTTPVIDVISAYRVDAQVGTQRRRNLNT